MGSSSTYQLPALPRLDHVIPVGQSFGCPVLTPGLREPGESSPMTRREPWGGTPGADGCDFAPTHPGGSLNSGCDWFYGSTSVASVLAQGSWFSGYHRDHVERASTCHGRGKYLLKLGSHHYYSIRSFRERRISPCLSRM